MRIKVVMFGSDPMSLMADAQLLREKGLLVITAYNMQTVNELVNEVRPDVVFFDPTRPNYLITEAYSAFKQYSKIPVIFTIAEDDSYMVTRSRTNQNVRAIITDNVLDAVTIALQAEAPASRPANKARTRHGTVPVVRAIPLFT